MDTADEVVGAECLRACGVRFVAAARQHRTEAGAAVRDRGNEEEADRWAQGGLKIQSKLQQLQNLIRSKS
jgi:hypothetical protein